VIADLVKRKDSKPRTQRTLLAAINARFNRQLTEAQL